MNKRLSNTNKRGRFFAFFYTSIFVFSMLISTVFIGSKPQPVSAITPVAANYGLVKGANGKIQARQDEYILEWIDAATIQISFKYKPDIKLIAKPYNEQSNGTSALIDQRKTGNQIDYVIEGWECDPGKIFTSSKDPDTKITEMDVDIDFKPDSASPCTDVGTIKKVPVANPDMSIAYFQWADSATIKGVDDFTRDDNKSIGSEFIQAGPDVPNVFLQSDQLKNDCPNKLLVLPGNKVKLYFLDTNFTETAPPEVSGGGKCKFQKEVTLDGHKSPVTSDVEFPLANVAAATNAAGSAATANGATSETPSCELSDSAISWIICPIITLGLKVTTSIFGNFIQPYLEDTGISTDSTTGFYKAWANFRTIGNILLLFGLLFLVFGQSIGGGLVDAYTAKKLLPRVVIAAIAINLSIYLVAIANDIILVIGNGIGTLITAPFKDAGVFKLKIDGITSNVAGFLGVGLLGYLLYGAVGRFIDGGFFGKDGVSGLFKSTTAAGTARAGAGNIGLEIMGLLITVLIPVFLITLAVLGTIIIRNAILMFTALVAPVAIALMVIPGAEKYFKKWRELFFSSLLVYPIIVVFFALGNVISSLILYNNEGSLFGNIIAIVALFAPMIMIPFAFKFAGGAIGAAYGAIQNYGNKAKSGIYGDEKDPNSFRNRWLHKRDASRANRLEQATRSAEKKYNEIQGTGMSASLRRGFARTRINTTSRGQDIRAMRAQYNMQGAKMVNDITQNGDDEVVRATTVNEEAALATGERGRGIEWREQPDGSIQFRTLAGAWVSQAAVREARARYGHDISFQQAALTYEMGKAVNKDQVDRVMSRVGSTMDGWHLSDEQRAGVWAGAKFGNQNTNLQFKYTTIGKDGSAVVDGRALLEEVDEKRGTYLLSQQNADTITTMRETVVEAKEVISTGRKRDGTIATTSELESAGDVLRRARRIAAANEGRSGVPSIVTEGDNAGAPTGVSGGAGAPGRVQEELDYFLGEVKSIDPRIDTSNIRYEVNAFGQGVMDPKTGRTKVVPGSVTTIPGMPVSAAASPYIQDKEPAPFRSERQIKPGETIDPASGEVIINPREHPGDGPELKPPTPAV